VRVRVASLVQIDDSFVVDDGHTSIIRAGFTKERLHRGVRVLNVVADSNFEGLGSGSLVLELALVEVD
jgi:hypothetical protein